MFRKRQAVACALLLLSVASGLAADARPAVAGERHSRWQDVIVDWRTGLALYGIDPVAYFVDRKPVRGLPEFETSVAGATWRFRNEGNRAAFIAAPEVYIPQFGGFDPVAVGRKIAAQGNPLVWAMQGDRLFFFYSEATRRDFLADPESAIAAASREWPGLVQRAATKGAGPRD